MDQALDLQGLALGGDSWTRTNDPIDVNDVLYRLSHATMSFSEHFSRRIHPSGRGDALKPRDFGTSLVGKYACFALPTEPCDLIPNISGILS